ncbi:hypothetical protein [Endozoicomonas sp. GU-1]|nr:hypothetical protein [Endozoicomonas sp. GU-1]WBA81363.1 hypothetical protein O2T12_24300 [Endozoicomonas sp. GU-1]WBA84311.1 hypothetical protein O3276_13470 [Endozoicomonas sp. GU-1]
MKHPWLMFRQPYQYKTRVVKIMSGNFQEHRDNGLDKKSASFRNMYPVNR